MKSIYVDNQLHQDLKFMASIEKKTIADIVQEFLRESILRNYYSPNKLNSSYKKIANFITLMIV